MKAKSYMLDTDMFSYLVSGRHPSVRKRVAAHQKAIVLSSVTMAEALFGARKKGSERLESLIGLFRELFPVRPWGRERISDYVEQYLLDDVVPSYIRCVVAQKRPGWEDIRCLVPWIEGMQKTRRNGTDRFEEAIQRDSVSMFEICRSLGFGKLTRPVLRELLDLDDAGNVAEHILTECPECYKLMPAREMLLHICVACHNEAKAVRLVKCLLKRDPDICQIVDRNGFTPLVYMMFAHRRWTYFGRYDDMPVTWRSGLASLLVENGYDPGHRDRFGVSYNDIANMPDAGVYQPASAA